MPRFSDEWVIDRVLIESVLGGSCNCCGIQMFLPGGTADLIAAVSDIDTDQVSREVLALQNHPWPVDLRDQVWADRVRLRQYLKKSMNNYKSFWTEHGDGFVEWCHLQGVKPLARLVQLGRSELLEHVQKECNIHSAYGVVLCAVAEQVAHFEVTQYPPDARGVVEAEFEQVLTFDRRGGFTLPLRQKKDTESVNEEVLQTWFRQMQSLGGPKLLERGSRSRTEDDDDDNDGEEGDADGPAAASASAGSSFQSDRRLLRLLIARYWADIFQKRYIADQEEKKEETTSETVSNGAAVKADAAGP
jgi:hypothetical protein